MCPFAISSAFCSQKLPVVENEWFSVLTVIMFYKTFLHLTLGTLNPWFISTLKYINALSNGLIRHSEHSDSGGQRLAFWQELVAISHEINAALTKVWPEMEIFKQKQYDIGFFIICFEKLPPWHHASWQISKKWQTRTHTILFVIYTLLFSKTCPVFMPNVDHHPCFTEVAVNLSSIPDSPWLLTLEF